VVRLPVFSLIVPMRDAGPWLGELLESLTRQAPGPFQLEGVFVDDGSTDQTADLAAAWLDARAAAGAMAGRLLRQPRTGLAAARQAGLAAASGDWVTFLNPTDFLDTRYLAAVAHRLTAPEAGAATLLAANIVYFRQATGVFEDAHPLKAAFGPPARNVRLSDDPELIPLGVDAVFFRRDDLARDKLDFPAGRNAANRELFPADELFAARVLLAAADPVIGVVPDARCYQRLLPGQDPVTGSARHHRSAYIERFRDGYLPLLTAVAAGRRQDAAPPVLGGAGPSPVPRWLGNLVLFQLAWLFDAERDITRWATALGDNDRRAFLTLVTRLCRYLDPAWIRAYSLPALSVEIRCLLLALSGEDLADVPIWIDAWDARQRQVLLRYVFTGPPPAVVVTEDGRPTAPAHGKLRSLDYFGQSALREGRAWVNLAGGNLSVRLDGAVRTLRLGDGRRSAPFGGYGPAGLQTVSAAGTAGAASDPAAPSPKPAGRDRRTAPSQSASQAWTAIPTRAVKAHFAARPPDGAVLPYARPPAGPRTVQARLKAAARRLLSGAYVALARRWPRVFAVHVPSASGRWLAAVRHWPTRLWVESPLTRRRYRRAWLLMDRINQAQDNAEHLYRHVAAHHPETPLYFALHRDTPDWRRLAADGFNLVPYRSARHLALVRHAAHIASSHADHEIVHPAPNPSYPFPLDRAGVFTFLQHGVLATSDLSTWLDSRDFDQMAVTTPQERDALTADGTSSRLTTKEVALTGLARYDRLTRLARAKSATRRDILLVAPTWRASLIGHWQHGDPVRALAPDAARQPWAAAWLGLLRSPAFLSAVADAGWRVVYFPHPQMADVLDPSSLPPDVEQPRYADTDVQRLLVSTRLLVTDYSSIAFDAAYAGAAVVYYQFDQAEFFSGRHTCKPGFFSFGEDGFGPVCVTAAGVVEALRTAARRPAEADTDPFRERAARFFHFADERSCARVVAAMRALDHPPESKTTSANGRLNRLP
jgi:hypothetical protein